MAYATYDHHGHRRVGRVDGDHLVPLAGPTEIGRDTPTLTTLQECPDLAVPLAQARLAPVVPRPDKIICVGLNYHAHVGETRRELPQYPVLFTKFAASLTAAGVDIPLPPESSQVDYEGELAVVIGKPGRRIPKSEATQHILGYTVANDVTMRDHQYKTHQWLQGKAWDRSTPLGPYLVLPEEVDLTGAGIRTIVDGQTVQSATLSDLIFDIPTLVATISQFTTLLPGDVILTGTPGGVGYRRTPQLFLTDGATVTVEIDGVGTLTNRACAEQVLTPVMR